MQFKFQYWRAIMVSQVRSSCCHHLHPSHKTTMGKSKRRRDGRTKAVTASQKQLEYKPVRRCRSKEQTPLAAELLKAFLANNNETTEYGWELTSNPTIVAKQYQGQTYWYIQVSKRKRPTDRKGERRYSQMSFATQIEAENNAFDERYKLEGSNARAKLQTWRYFTEAVINGDSLPETQAATAAVVSPNTNPRPAKKKRATKKKPTILKLRSAMMSAGTAFLAASGKIRTHVLQKESNHIGQRKKLTSAVQGKCNTG